MSTEIIPAQHYDQRWSDRGACSGLAKQNPKLYDQIFFPEKGRPASHPQYEQYCKECPVRMMCYKYALVNDLDGIWGNTTKSERDALPGLLRLMIEAEAQKLGYIEHYAVPQIQRHTMALTILIDEFVEFSEEPLEPQDFRFSFQYEKYVERTEHMIEVMESSVED